MFGENYLNNEELQEDSTTTPKEQTESIENATAGVDISINQLIPGLLIIFNNDEFEHFPSRPGSQKDVEKLRSTFETFHFEITTYENLNLAEMQSVITTYQYKSFKNYSCLVVAALSHGGRFDFLSARDQNFSFDDEIILPLLLNETLVKKPKIFILQACQGEFDIIEARTDSSPLNRRYSPRDILRLYSTSKGFLLYQSNAEGSCFIQSLCELLDQYGHTMPITQVMDRTIQLVIERTQERQVPCYLTSLSRPIIFGEFQNTI